MLTSSSLGKFHRFLHQFDSCLWFPLIILKKKMEFDQIGNVNSEGRDFDCDTLRVFSADICALNDLTNLFPLST